MAGPFKMKGSPMQRNFGVGGPMKKTYKKAYEDADKSKYKTYKEFETAAKGYNVKKYGTTEPTKESNKLVGKYEGDMTTSSKVTKGTAKKELASRHQVKKDDTAKLKADVKKRDTDVKSGKAKKIVSSVTNKEAVDYRKTGPKTKKRTKVGKLGVKVANIFRGKKKKVNPYRKPAKS